MARASSCGTRLAATAASGGAQYALDQQSAERLWNCRSARTRRVALHVHVPGRREGTPSSARIAVTAARQARSRGMTARLAFCLLALMTVACGQDQPAAVENGRLVLTKSLHGAPLFMEGSLTHVRIVRDDGTPVVDRVRRREQAGSPLFDERLPSGRTRSRPWSAPATATAATWTHRSSRHAARSACASRSAGALTSNSLSNAPRQRPSAAASHDPRPSGSDMVPTAVSCGPVRGRLSAAGVEEYCVSTTWALVWAATAANLHSARAREVMARHADPEPVRARAARVQVRSHTRHGRTVRETIVRIAGRAEHRRFRMVRRIRRRSGVRRR